MATQKTLIEDMQHLAENAEGPHLPPEVKPILSFLLGSFTVASPVQSVGNHHSFFTHDGNIV